MLQRADQLIFAKTMAVSVHRLCRRWSPTARSILVTPYRPAELWHDSTSRERLESILDTFDDVIVQATSFARDLEELAYKGRTHVIPYLPREGSPVKERAKGRSINIGFLGRLAPQKDVRLLVETFALFLATAEPDFPECFLHVFGEGPEREVLEREAQRLEVSQSLRLHGNVPRRRVEECIDSCDAFLYTSHTEGQCLGAMEILGRGRPIVATKVGAFEDLIFRPELGKVVAEREPAALANALWQAIEWSSTSGGSARARQEIFNERFCRATILAKYRELLSGQG